MEDSAYQALYTGVYVFVFLIALSSTIFLFKSISDYADLAYDYGHTVVSDNIIENISDSKERILTGSDVLVYFFNYSERDKFFADSGSDQKNTNYNITYNNIKIENNEDYASIRSQIEINSNYVIKYTSLDKNGVPTLTISKKDK